MIKAALEDAALESVVALSEENHRLKREVDVGRIPEAYGGSGVGYDGLCVLAEELGYVLAPVPFSSSIYLAAEPILIAGSEAQKQKLLPPMIDGSRIGTAVPPLESASASSPSHRCTPYASMSAKS